MSDVMIAIRDLHKSFGPLVAVDGVTFDVERGEVLGFLGPNGAGKSTTMKMVTGFLPPTRGTASVCGHDVVKEPLAAKRVIGYLPEGAPAYPDMTPESFLRFVGEVRGMGRADRRRRVEEVADLVHLRGVMRQPIETLSKGYKRRVGLAQALLHDPEVLILDEPTDGLDPNQKHEVRSLIREMAGRKAIVLSTHILEEVDAVCSRAIIIARGRIVADGTPEELRARSARHNAVRLTVRVEGDGAGERVVRELGSAPGVSSVEVASRSDGELRCLVLATGGEPVIGAVGEHAKSRGWDVVELHVAPTRLDEVFRSVTHGELDARASMSGGEEAGA